MWINTHVVYVVLFEFPWQWGYGGFALYLIGIAQTLADVSLSYTVLRKAMFTHADLFKEPQSNIWRVVTIVIHCGLYWYLDILGPFHHQYSHCGGCWCTCSRCGEWTCRVDPHFSPLLHLGWSLHRSDSYSDARRYSIDPYPQPASRKDQP